MTMRASSFHTLHNIDTEMVDGTHLYPKDPSTSKTAPGGSYTVARLPTELYGLIASFVLSERPIAKIHTFRKSPWRIVAGASVASRAMRAAIMHAWFRVLRIRQVGDFNFIDQKMNWMFPWVRYVFLIFQLEPPLISIAVAERFIGITVSQSHAMKPMSSVNLFTPSSSPSKPQTTVSGTNTT
jgi:hypothetical protein